MSYTAARQRKAYSVECESGGQLYRRVGHVVEIAMNEELYEGSACCYVYQQIEHLR